MPTELRVLCVDDDARFRTALGTLLETLGHAVDTAEDGAVAIKRILDDQYDVVFTDFQMAELTGLDVAATAKGASRNTHVVLISAFSPSFIKRQIGGNLPDAILKKPVTMDTIKSVLDRLVVR